ncbi:EscR/YscR/HrcR family type III secretion system export apparatus protein [Acerihabitans arboris]|uniref:EscR/YscR/HrcR family type III secretion system export apparatus protein n=1 Tax=Acerihabitans arboris TaxID=2691583 RepID=A0A845SC85_9GAMM|nr:EscR/YscR/HrcR family type III secretion system export apparatus protein [Acerihabitans arboris]NDL61519.1 EscR/YscR/HrcR family type III secretion system export apparatus protein [Acerihabitans arboris]
MTNEIGMIATLSFLSLLPFLIASGTCYVKFSIVFVIVRNALGLQQVPSNMTLNGVALILAMFVMAPVARDAYNAFTEENVQFTSVETVVDFVENGMSGYKAYLQKYADPELAEFFEKAQSRQSRDRADEEEEATPSMLALLPAYALSEIKNAFKIGFYLYLPFVVVDLLISSILLSLGMMMMSPITISVPIKLILFVVLDGWTLLSKGLIMQYIDLAT